MEQKPIPLRFTIHDSRYGGEQEKRPCGQFSAAHLLVQDREKGETIPLTKVIYSKAQWAPDSNDWRLAIAN